MARGTVNNLPRTRGGRVTLLKTMGHTAKAVRQIVNKAGVHHALVKGKGGDSTAIGQMGTGGSGMAGPNIMGG
jgi:hypothetical protein